ncbi:MAG: AzlD domain-containing protein [bacterium]|nr:AzlD domain-containing protein [bacterium]
MSWPLMIALVAGSYGLKALGISKVGGRIERRLGPAVTLLPAALFAALVVIMTFEDAGTLTLDARAAGVAAGAVAVWRKAPLILVVAVAMAVTAAVRALT